MNLLWMRDFQEIRVFHDVAIHKNTNGNGWTILAKSN